MISNATAKRNCEVNDGDDAGSTSDDSSMPPLSSMYDMSDDEDEVGNDIRDSDITTNEVPPLSRPEPVTSSFKELMDGHGDVNERNNDFADHVKSLKLLEQEMNDLLRKQEHLNHSKVTSAKDRATDHFKSLKLLLEQEMNDLLRKQEHLKSKQEETRLAYEQKQRYLLRKYEQEKEKLTRKHNRENENLSAQLKAVSIMEQVKEKATKGEEWESSVAEEVLKWRNLRHIRPNHENNNGIKQA